jgi:competence protein ComEC
MQLVYGVAALAAGIGLGWAGRQIGWWGCDVAPWLWIVPLVALPWTPRLNHLRPASQPLRWPISAGFAPLLVGIRWGLWVSLTLWLTAGALRMASAPYAGCRAADDLANWNLPASAARDRNAPQVMLEGEVVNFPVARDRQTLVLRATRLAEGGSWREVQGQVRFTLGPTVRYTYGDRLQVQGQLTEPPDFAGFSYRDYLARQGIHSILARPEVVRRLPGSGGRAFQRWVYAVRERGLAAIDNGLPEPYAALAAGILLGIDDGISQELYDRFNATGTSHVLVISGANVALIAALLVAVTRRMVGRWAWIPALSGIALYALLVGGDAAVLRAATMGGLVVVAGSVGRQSTALVSLAAACSAMLLANPQTLFDAGFQLSALATLGLILFSRPLLKAVSLRWPALRAGGDLGRILRGVVVEAGVMTLSATILTLPLIAYHFQRVSLLGMLVNLIVTPVQPLVLVAGTLAVGLGIVAGSWASLPLLWVTWLGLVWTERWVSWAAALPGASLSVSGYGLAALLITYGAIWLVAVAARTGRPKLALPRPQLGWLAHPGGLAALTVAATLVWWAALTQPDGRLHLYFLDVGQGDAIFVVTPTGRQVLIDGGAQRERLLTELGAVMPWWDRTLDLVIATHADQDHMGSQAVVAARFEVAQVGASPAMTTDPEAAAWRAAFVNQGAAAVTLAQGGWIDLGSGVALWGIWPPAALPTQEDTTNESSLVVKLVYGEFSALLTGDAGIASEQAWLAAGAPIAATVLKVGHHGSTSSTSRTLLDAVDPTLAVIQVGADNRYGHPAPDVLKLLAGHTILRTDLDGRIHLVSDGAGFWRADQ